MKKIIQEIFQKELKEEIHSINKIDGLGSVNSVFDIKGNKGEYILRLNDSEKEIEYKKEKWCLDEVLKLGIPSPKVIKMGFQDNISFMILEKISGNNGSFCQEEEKEIIWKKLGTYASKYHDIQRIKDKEVEENEFHKNWKARLEYNMLELNENDGLLKNKVINKEEQEKIKEALSNLRNKEFKVGLVHGDLSPRNVIWSSDDVYLLDWGTSEINVVPHVEIGILLMSKEASEKEFKLFINGLGLSVLDYKKIEKEIRILNLLHRLDKYRWAEEYDVENIKDYEIKIRETFNKILLNK